MIVPQRLASRIQAGKPSLHILRAIDDQCPFQQGQTVPIHVWTNEQNPFTHEQQRRKARQCHAVVVSNHKTNLTELEDEHFQAAGYKSQDELLGAWKRVKPQIDIWLVTLKLTETRRFLTSQSEYSSVPLGITDREAARKSRPWWTEEPEAVAEAVSDDYASEAKQHNDLRQQQRRERWEAQRLSDRVRALEAARESGADVGLQLAAIERRVRAAENRLRRDAA